jgi:hypothetical protein
MGFAKAVRTIPEARRADQDCASDHGFKEDNRRRALIDALTVAA